MSSAFRDASPAQTYLNPVHARDFPDPYVFKFAGEYFAYCTGFWRDGRAFGVMRSRDLVRWEELAGALELLPGEHPCYWAPEVYYHGGKFLMYYSVGNETLMHVRVAVADHPAGLFTDSGRRLTAEEFAIDPHVFTDRDGQRYLFYATDFLAHTHVGTGTVVDRLVDDFTLEGRPRPVTRARYDWQVYDPARREKGGVRWHTVEGPFVLERKGRYYEMFSGGNWQNVSYGVSYAASDRVLGAAEWEQHADGEKVLPILRTIPEKVIGPGHNSVVRAPDNQQLFCVYHRWAEEGRVLAIDRMEFVGDSLAVLGPTTTPQPAPNVPWFADYFDASRAEGLGEAWERVSGRWSIEGGEARQESTEGEAEARCLEGGASFVAEVTLRSLADGEQGAGAFGISLSDGSAHVLRFQMDGAGQQATLSWHRRGAWAEGEARELPPDFDPRVFHQLRIEVDVAFVSVSLDDGAVRWQGSLDADAGLSPNYHLSLLTENCAAAFRGFTLTRGFADEFDDPAASVRRGWDFGGASDAGEPVEGKFEGALLRLSPSEGVSRGGLVAHESFELILNVRLEGEDAGGDAVREYSLSPGVASAEGQPLSFVLERGEGGSWALSYVGDGSEQTFALPLGFAPREFQQFRFRRERGRLIVQVGAAFVCEVSAAFGGGSVSVAAGASPVLLDLARLTAIKSS
ncbi:MAG: glycoside hydrolase family 43 protein [Pyrinomonadaceae bacterium]